MKYEHGFATLSLPLPSRRERCQFTLLPATQTLNDLVSFLEQEDKGTDYVAVYSLGTFCSVTIYTKLTAFLCSKWRGRMDYYYFLFWPSFLHYQLELQLMYAEGSEVGWKYLIVAPADLAVEVWCCQLHFVMGLSGFASPFLVYSAMLACIPLALKCGAVYVFWLKLKFMLFWLVLPRLKEFTLREA